MRRILALPLALLSFVAFTGCQTDPLAVTQAKTFYGKIDSANFAGAWELLTDEDKAVMDQASFVAALTDSMRLPGFDTIEEWKVVHENGDTAVIGTSRMAPDWNRLDDIKSRLNRSEQLKNLRDNGNLPRRRDSMRTVTVIKTKAGPRFHIGLAKIKAFIAARDSIAKTLARKVSLKFTDAIVENNFQAFFHVTGKVSNAGDLDLSPVVIKINLRGKLAGTITLSGRTKVPAKGSYSGEMPAYYENDLTPQKFGTSWDRGAVKIPVSALRGEVASALPADRAEFDRMTIKAIGGVAPPVIF